VPLDYRYPSPLEEGVLLRRYKRFLADVRLDDGRELTVHCANPGAMTTCSTPGSRVRVRAARHPKRKLSHNLEQVRSGRAWVQVNTALPNAAMAAACRRHAIPGLPEAMHVRREVADGHGSRLDLRLDGSAGRCWIEVKSVTLRVGREARFPDAVTARGLKHLGSLERLCAAGDRAVMLFLVGRADVDRFRPAWEIDPAYAEGLGRAHAAGVEIIVVRAHVTRLGFGAGLILPYDLDHA